MTLLTAIVIVGYLVLAFAIAPKPLPKKKVTERGIASYYSDELAGKPMANGQPYDPLRFTAASWHYKLGTVVKVKNVKNDLVVFVEVTDRGPARRLNRVIDLSRAAFDCLGDLKDGLIEVEITP